MKKNRMMRLASILLVCVLLSTSVISGTFAKYTSTAGDKDTARVAYWGFGQDSSIVIADLFTATYNNVASKDNDDVIAPGTSNFKTFKFAYKTNVDETAAAPEVAYDFTVSIDGSKIDKDIYDNPNIQWALVKGAADEVPAADSKEWGSWDQLMTDILHLSGDTTKSYTGDSGTKSVTKRYEANTAPSDFADGTVWTVAWQWKFSTTEDQDKADTKMGNKADLDDVAIYINITATQVD